MNKILRLEISEKLWLYPNKKMNSWKNITEYELHELHEPTRKNRDSLLLSRTYFWLIGRYHDVPCSPFYFLFRTNCMREQLDENHFCCCYGNFFESAILKELYHSQCSKFFPTITSYISNFMWKTQGLYGHQSVKVLTLSLLNILKTKIDEGVR